MCSLSTWASDIAVNTAFGHRLEHVAIGEEGRKREKGREGEKEAEKKQGRYQR